MKKLLVVSTRKGPLYSASNEQLARGEQLMFAEKINGIPTKPFILQSNGELKQCRITYAETYGYFTVKRYLKHRLRLYNRPFSIDN